MVNKDIIADWFKGLQDRICEQLEGFDGEGEFQQDQWERPGGGGGRTRIIEGKVIEKGGVNFSAVHGEMPEKISKALGIAPGIFFATGVSIVLHPVNPWVPIIHMNVRYFEVEPHATEEKGVWWFGGGIDLTPHYVFPEDARYFHQELKRICDKHHLSYYPEFKKWADDYFFIKHRNETRGVGGIFFDRLSEGEEFTKDIRFDFVKDVGELFAPVYTAIAGKYKDKVYTEAEQAWQFLRRGRYVEFNLVLDRGTKFGLDTSGRTESILMSLPPRAHWAYAHEPEEGSLEHQTLNLLKKNIDWIFAVNGER